ncbi:tetratricopeptide repeat protein [Qipengyuania oceanensis]|uniref:DUF560 domain-containing protein n=1 Tax=Qipengyuania oceanensis TaxID=1463597 RepID=A0A844YH47_9SPHN|nr:DUF560 domain-containing protein [Qipengyuania oceanensis]
MLIALIFAMQAMTDDRSQEPLEGTAAAPSVSVSADDMLRLSQAALARGDRLLASRILEALLEDPQLGIRNEARFRLAMLASSTGDWGRAGGLLRRILDEEPGAQRARLELARVQSEMGQLDAARKTLREAQAGGLPPDVARLVDRFSAALRDRRPYGASLNFAFAPDSNVNRATRSDTLATVIGDFDLAKEDKQRSGIGVSIGGEAFARLRLDEATTIVTRAGIASNIYRRGRFNDHLLVGSIGPEFDLSSGRLLLSFGAQRRWFGGEQVYNAWDLQARWQRPIGRRTQVQATLGYAYYDYRANELQDAHLVSATGSWERALSRRSGMSVTLGGTRQIARDPAYSSVSGQVGLVGWLDLSRTTLFGALHYQHSENDRRLSIYPKRRSDDYLKAGIGATFRGLSWHEWAPQFKLSWESNRSPIEIYDYQRWRSEFGIARAF